MATWPTVFARQSTKPTMPATRQRPTSSRRPPGHWTSPCGSWKRTFRNRTEQQMRSGPSQRDGPDRHQQISLVPTCSVRRAILSQAVANTLGALRHVVGGVLDVALHLIGLAFRFRAAVTGDLADGFLHVALDLVDRARGHL